MEAAKNTRPTTATPNTKASPATLSMSPSSPSPSPTSTPSSNNNSLARNETRLVHALRCAVLLLLLITTSLVSSGVFVYMRQHERERFETVFGESAFQVLESFQDALEHSLLSLDTLSVSITSFANAVNQTFPFVTMPDFEVRGCSSRVQSGSHALYYLPIVTDANREAWEDYALQHRSQADDAFAKDEYYRKQQDLAYGRRISSTPTTATATTTTSTSTTSTASSSNIQNSSNATLNNMNQTTKSHPKDNQPIQSDGLNLTVLNDGSGYHPKIWRQSSQYPLGDEPEGGGPYLPVWHKSPIFQSSEGMLNWNFRRPSVMVGILEAMMEHHKATIGRAVIPELPSDKAILEANLKVSQYRDDVADYANDLTTFLVYPIFDRLNAMDGAPSKKLVALLATNVYWKFFLSRLLPQGVRGIIFVAENSYNQSFTYRIDGPQATLLGMGDLHDPKYNHLEVKQDINAYLRERSTPRNRAYTTVPVDETTGQYRIRVYPSADMETNYQTNDPFIYTMVVLVVFVFTSVVFLLFTHVVEKRQAVMMETAIAAAQQAADDERKLNEFIAHEVRNPLAAAMSASTFVATTLQQPESGMLVADSNALEMIREDIQVVSASLSFINDFLRSMLDIQRLRNQGMQLHMATIDVLHDIFEPVSAMLYRRDVTFEVSVDCPKNLFVKTDCLRLKQVVLNLVRNSSKFVEDGFIRMRADVVQGQVQLFVEDTGPGIPPEKYASLFTKFQASLDRLSQGTGVGLCLSKQLMTALGGDLWLDMSYDSGMPNRPGARFVVDLKVPPVRLEQELDFPSEASVSLTQNNTSMGSDILMGDAATPSIVDIETGCPPSSSRRNSSIRSGHDPPPRSSLPEHLSILFVDDDAILRKLFMRAVRKVGGPAWQIREAASGEMALQLCATENFDLIFLDQYMASIDKQLLGTETARALRSDGVTSKICGLSANDLSESFLNAGADYFILKPMPCIPDELRQTLYEILNL